MVPPILLLFTGGVDDPISPASVPSATVVPGPVAFGTAVAAILPASVPSVTVVPGPQAPPNPALGGPIRPASVTSATIVPGPWISPDPADDDPTAPYLLSVADQPYAKNITATPQLTDIGTGQYVVPRGERPAEGTITAYKVKGRTFFVGRAANIEDVELDRSYEVGQTATVTTPGLLDDWRRVVVLPDYGAQDVSRLGPPTQDTRIFDWTMNGGQGDLSGSLTPSLAADGNYGRVDETFPLPDVWPDPNARWMWATPPAQPAPRGYCHFRVPFWIAAGKIQVWATAWDYADVWMDGVQVLTCDTPGVAQHLELTVRADFHNLTIRGYNSGGTAGILASVLPVQADGLYGEPWMNSRGGWRCLAYPTRSFRNNPGQIMSRLHLEAQRRGVGLVGDWELDFKEDRDSAGRPWPANAPVSIEVGMTYLDVLRRLGEDLVDFVASPSGRRLKMYVKDKGTGHSGPLPWTAGVDMGSLVNSSELG
jgi:hypothetical protein